MSLYSRIELTLTTDIYVYHREFPLLRTPSKVHTYIYVYLVNQIQVHALDDVMQIITKEMGLPFMRTAVLLPPKCKSRFKRKREEREN